VKPQPFPQQVVKDLPGQGGRKSMVERRVHHVRGHERGDFCARGATEGEQFAEKERPLPCPDDGQFLVGVGGRVAVPREMFSDRQDPPGERSPRESDSECGRNGRVIGKGAVADHRVCRVAVNIEDRREVHVDPNRPQLGGGRRARTLRHGFVPATEEGAGAGRRKPGERGFLEPRHAASLLVDGDQREGIPPAGGGSDFSAKGAHLGGAFDVAGVEDDAADLPAGEPSQRRCRKRLPVEADPEGGGDAVSMLHAMETLSWGLWLSAMTTRPALGGHSFP
jgi:hypothetical protein